MNLNEFVLTEVRLWEASKASASPLRSALHVRDGRIHALGEAAERAPSEIPRRPFPGRFVVPGLIDAHVHLELDPALHSPADQMAVPEATRVEAMAVRAAEMVAAGITTARDCGGGAHWELGLRRDIDAGFKVGPRLLCCGQPLTSRGGHCAFWGGEVETAEEIDAMVRRQSQAGVDWIKVMATGGVFTPGSRARDAQFDVEALRGLVEVAAAQGHFVAAHCHGTEGIAHATRAGVRTIEHASFAGPDGFGTAIDEPLMEEMAAASLWVSPTVNGGWGRRRVDDEGRPTDFFRRLSGLFAAQRRHGLRWIASTDAGIPGVKHHDLVSGLLAFAEFAALRPVDVLRSATCESADALGLSQETGRLAPGLSADLLILPSDPTVDLAVLRTPERVMLRGQWVEPRIHPE